MARGMKLATNTTYGRRKLSEAEFAAQEEKKVRTGRDGTVYGKRKTGAKRPDRPQPKTKGEPGLPAPATDPSVLRARDVDTRIGDRKGGQPDSTEGAGPVRVDTPQENPFIEASVATVEKLLEERPELVDLAIQTELARDKPRKGVVGPLRKAERARPGGPREKILKVLDHLTDD